MLKSKLITGATSADFEYNLDQILAKIDNGSVQYRSAGTTSGRVSHSALVIFEVPDDVEGDEHPNAAPTGGN